jgi:hypothetical protein
MTKLLDLIQSEPFWAVIAVIFGYLANSVVSRGLLAKLPPTSWQRRAIRALHGFLNRVDPMVLVVAFVLPFLSACAGTFEESRLAQPGALQASPIRLSSDRCVTLSDREYWFGVTSVATGSTGAGAVIAAFPASDKYETALMISGVSAAAVSVVSGVASSKAGASYVREGCAK